MRIVVLNPFMREGYSGPTVLMQRLFGELATKGHSIIALGPNPPDERATGITYVMVRTPPLQTVLGQLTWWIKCSNWLVWHRRAYDVVHVHSAYLYNILPTLVLHLIAKRYVLLPVAVGADFGPRSRTSRIPMVSVLKRSIVSRADAGFALADGNVAEFLQLGLPVNLIHRLNNPVAPEFFARRGGLTGVQHTLVFVGILGRRKSPHLVVEALSRLVAAGWNDANAVFIGPFENDEYEERFHSVVRRHRMRDRVSVTGFVPRVDQILHSLRGVFLLPSSQEGLPGALAEAMAQGMPVVVTDVGAMAEIARDSGAGFVVRADPSEIADVVHALWSKGTLYEAMSEKATLYAAQHFSSQAIATVYEGALPVGIG